MVAKLQNVPELSESNNQHPRTSSPPPLPLPLPTAAAAAASKLQQLLKIRDQHWSPKARQPQF
jgi:hypothetical protein